MMKKADLRNLSFNVQPLPVALLLMFFMVSSLFGETWIFSADQVSAAQGEKNSRTILKGAARVESEDMVILAENLELGGTDYDRITGSGGVSLTDLEKGLVINSQRFDYDRNAKIIRFRELVELVDEEEGIVIRCESMDFMEDEDLVIMQVTVRLIKDRTVCRGEFATFSRENNILEISGRPVVWRKDDEYRADRITVDLDTDEIVMEGAVQGALTTEKSEDSEGTEDE